MLLSGYVAEDSLEYDDDDDDEILKQELGLSPWSRVCKICEPASVASHRASYASHVSHGSHASHSTNVKNFYLFYLHSHENILGEFLTRAVWRHELSFRSRYQIYSFFFLGGGGGGVAVGLEIRLWATS